MTGDRPDARNANLRAPDTVAGDRLPARHGRRAMLAAATIGVTVPKATPAHESTTERGSWSRLANMPLPKDDFGIAVVAGQILTFGGMTGGRGTALDDAAAFDPAGNEWRRLPPLPTARRSARAAAIGSRVYVVGGATTTGTTGAVEVFDADGETWSTAAPLPTPRYGIGLAAIGGVLYAAGGFRDGQSLAVLERYDPEFDRWDALAPMAAPRTHPAAVALDGTLWLLGGQHRGEVTASVEIYDPATDIWIPRPPMPQAMSNFAAALLAGRIHVLRHATHAALDPASGEWSASTPMPTSRHGLGAAVVADALYAIGGCHQQLFDLDTTEVFLPPPHS